MKRFLIPLIGVLCGLWSVPALAQQDPNDPGLPDSLIIGSIHVDSGQTSAVIPISVVTDENVDYYGVALGWHAIGNDISCLGPIWYNPLLYFWWENAYLTQDSAVGLSGWEIIDEDTIHYPLNTSGQRAEIIRLHFFIEPTTPSQMISLDTLTFDERYPSVLFVTSSDGYEFAPVIQRGSISIGGANAGDGASIPVEHALEQNYPNPFNTRTTIGYALPETWPVRLEIYSIIGQKVATLFNGTQAAGEHRIVWDADDVPSGIYFYRLSAGSYGETKSMMFLK